MEGVAYLIRHAKAGDRSAWEQDDQLRPLTAAGKRQAVAIGELFASEPIERVISSPAVRCVQTIQPLADRRGVELKEDRSLKEGGGPDGASGLVRSVAPGSAVALCTHGDVIWELLADLEIAGVPLSEGLPAKKGSIWILRVVADSVVAGTYVPPPPG